MGQEYFTREEAEGKVGKRIQALREFSRIPQGSEGAVIEIDQASPTDYSLIIRWELPNPRRERRFDIGGEPVLFVTGGKPFVDWFTRDEYEHYLREV